MSGLAPSGMIPMHKRCQLEADSACVRTVSKKQGAVPTPDETTGKSGTVNELGEPSVSIRWPDTTAKTDSPSKAGEGSQLDSLSGASKVFRTHGPLGCGLQYF